MNRILLLEDDVSLIDGLVYSLKKNEFDVEVARTVCEAKQYLSELDRYDLLILDVTLPDGTGFDICEKVRKENQQMPIIFLTASDEEVSIIRGLDSGGDDYITKPFTLALVKMHIEAVLKRAGKLRTMVEYNDLQADVNAQLLFYKEQHIPTTRKEFDLIVYFMEHPGIVLPRDTILNAVWEYDYAGDVRTIDTLVKQLRKKLGEGCNYIRTVYGVGYIFGEDIHEN